MNSNESRDYRTVLSCTVLYCTVSAFVDEKVSLCVRTGTQSVSSFLVSLITSSST
jgi:hypothetical protein